MGWELPQCRGYLQMPRNNMQRRLYGRHGCVTPTCLPPPARRGSSHRNVHTYIRTYRTYVTYIHTYIHTYMYLDAPTIGDDGRPLLKRPPRALPATRQAMPSALP